MSQDDGDMRRVVAELVTRQAALLRLEQPELAARVEIACPAPPPAPLPPLSATPGLPRRLLRRAARQLLVHDGYLVKILVHMPGRRWTQRQLSRNRLLDSVIQRTRRAIH